MSFLTVDGFACPPLSGFSTSFEDIDVDSGRDLNGVLHRTRIRTDVIKLNCTWQYVADQAAFRALVNKLKSLPPTFQVTYPDPNGQMISFTAYRGNPFACDMYAYWDIGPNGILEKWLNTKVNFIQI